MTRLPILRETIRKLYLYSGNECAFPGCHARLFNDDGVYIAQLAHIEAAEPGGPRYNAAQSDEDRRHYDNLLHLCHEHHKVTDDENAYPVARMQKMKADHEARFGENAVQRMADALQDLTDLQHVGGAFSLARLNATPGWGLDPVELQDTADKLRAFAGQLADIPRQHRSILFVIVNKGKSTRTNRDRFVMTVHELAERLGLDGHDLYLRIDLLQRHRLVELETDTENGVATVETRPQLDLDGFPVWHDITEFARVTGTDLREVLVDLNFGVFD